MSAHLGAVGRPVRLQDGRQRGGGGDPGQSGSPPGSRRGSLSYRMRGIGGLDSPDPKTQRSGNGQNNTSLAQVRSPESCFRRTVGQATPLAGS